MSSLATTIVRLDTQALINEADNIVKSCSGTNCNTSNAVRTSITESLSFLAQQQSNATLRYLSISSSSVLGRQIYEAYLDLSASVSSVYNFQCGNNTITSSTCVPNALPVITAQNNLQTLLVTPAINNAKHIAVLSLTAFLLILTFGMFIFFLFIGLFEYLVEVV